MTGRTRWWRTPVVALGVALGAVLAAIPAAAVEAPDRAPTGCGPPRLLVFAVPGLTWEELGTAETPNLDAFLRQAGVANLAPRSVRHGSRPGDAYLTIASGARAVGVEEVDGLQFNADAGYAGDPAGSVFARRTGREPDGEIVSLGWGVLGRANAAQPYDAELGLLAATLADHGVHTAVIANADGSEGAEPRHHRQAALGLVDPGGELASGLVGDELLAGVADAPYGVALDLDAAEQAHRDVWTRPGPAGVVSLVEASDLARTIRYQPLVSPERYAELRQMALRGADALFGRLRASVNEQCDGVLVLGPYHEPGSAGLTVAGLRAPGVGPGYLRTASTQRAGIITLVDVAPTLLDRFGIPRPAAMEGRAAEVVAAPPSYGERRAGLVADASVARFRSHLLTPTTAVLVLALGVAVAGVIGAIAGPWSLAMRRRVALVPLFVLAGLPASFLARAVPAGALTVPLYWALFVAGSGVLAAAAAAIAARTRQPVLGAGFLLAVTVAVLVGDVMTGSHLHLGSAFGYSPSGNSRLYGISNYSFGQLAAASSLLAVAVAWRWPSRAGRAAAIGLLVATLVVLGVPVWGADVGGVLAFTPATLVFAALLLRLRPTLRGVVAMVVVTAGAVVAFGLVDLARPPAQRAHLGRLFERIGDEGLQPLATIVERKLLANLRVSTSSLWLAALLLGAALWIFLRWWDPSRLGRLRAAVPSLPAGLAAAGVAGLLGSLANDSGLIVGGVVALVLTATVAYLVVAGQPARSPGEPVPKAAPSFRPRRRGSTRRPAPARYGGLPWRNTSS